MENNVACVTTDNAVNIANAVCDVLSWLHLGCFGYIAVKSWP